MDFKDYYAVLGVSRNAGEKDIKLAYRKLARQYHPDLHPNDKAAEARFREINEAYEVLSDSEKRKKYDMYGHQSFQSGFDPFSAYQRSEKSQGFDDIKSTFSKPIMATSSRS